MKNLLISFLIILVAQTTFAQSGIIKGKILNQSGKEPVPFANIAIQGTSQGAVSDEKGNYEINNLAPGLYNVLVSYIGFKSKAVLEIEISNARPALVNIELEEEAAQLEDVEITATGFLKNEESPLSLRSIGFNEIKRNPGGNRDISKAVRSLPGVASTPSFRNDILIRGGSPGENRFYLDGIEVPVINHFATQGASGGPVGIINVDFIREVDFYSGAFPANRGNSLSSIFEFKQKEGRNDKLALNAVVGASDIGLWLDGPLSPKSSFMFSARRSYLQFLFRLLDLPFLPTYNSFQLKYTYNLNEKNKITLIGLGAIDDFVLNQEAAKDSTEGDFEEKQYLLSNLPINNQWNYTIGVKYEHFRKDGLFTFVFSRNKLNNDAYKYPNNDESLPKNYDYRSQEIENKFRLEDYRYFTKGYKLNYGFNYEYARYKNRTLQNLFSPVDNSLVSLNYSSELNLHKWGLFGQLSKDFFKNRLVLSLGFRADANDYSEEMNNLLNQFSPRFSAAYNFSPRFSFNFNTGIYYQLPAYTILGYRENGELINRNNALEYIKNSHLVAGLEYRLDKRNVKFALEGFYKKYENYPFSLRNQISLANLGADFGVIGNEPVSSNSIGRAYGLEFLAQQKFFKGFYGILAYTFVRSEFANPTGNYLPSSWDSRHLVSITGGKQFRRGWEIGFRWLFSGGTPYTPYDIANSIKTEVWDVEQEGINDYSRLNSERIRAFHQLDIRIDKKYFFKKWSLDVFLDVQNVYNFQAETRPILNVEKDGNGNPIVNATDMTSYIPRFIRQSNGTVLPTIGIIVEL